MNFKECQTLARQLMSEIPTPPGWGERDIAIWLRDECRCTYCGMDMLQSYRIAYYFYHYDHLLPKSKYAELAEADWNLVLSCCACNIRKQAFDPNPEPPVYTKDSGKEPTKEDRAKLLLRARLHVRGLIEEEELNFIKQRERILSALLEQVPDAAVLSAHLGRR